MDENKILQAIGNLSKTVEENQKRTDEKFASLEKHMDGMEKRIDKIEQRMDGMEQRMDKIEQRMDNMENQLEETQNIVRKVALHVENKVERKVQLVLENQVKIINFTDKVQQIDDTVREHDSDIRLLKHVVTEHSKKIQQFS